ncbi:MAG: efflux RND transporter periplasmic adaptor subunit [Fuerstiella sp.]
MQLKLTVTILFAIVAAVTTTNPQLRRSLTTGLGLSSPEHGPAAADDGSQRHSEEGHRQSEHHVQHKIVATNSVAKDVTLTEQYVCQIHSRRHIELKALEGGYLKAIKVDEGQAVKKGETVFSILPTLYKAKLDADLAEAELCQVEYDNTRNLVKQKIVSVQELKLAKAKVDKALAKVELAQAEMDFAQIKAPFDGIIDRLHEQEGSLIEEGAMLTTMSDNSVMWVYFNVPEARYLAYQAALKDRHESETLDVELKLANQQIFPQPGAIGAIEADFDSETGNIAFRADFPNPDALLRHGQTGTILIHQVQQNAVVIPQRATFEILAKKYAFVIDDHHVVHQREIHIQQELDDIFIIDHGLEAGESIILEGLLQVRDGDKITYELKPGREVLADLKYHAE